MPLDFLAILQDELETHGLDYRVAAEVLTADAELPGLFNNIDVRLTDRDVILARAGVETTGAASDNFEVNLVISVGGVETTFLRGYTMVKAEVDGKAYRHWFDGLAMLHAFTFHERQISYTNRYLRTPTFRDNNAEGS